MQFLVYYSFLLQLIFSFDLTKTKIAILYIHRYGNFAGRSGGEIIQCDIIQIDNEGKKYLVVYSPFMKGVETSYWGFKWIKYKNTAELTNMEYADMLSKFF